MGRKLSRALVALLSAETLLAVALGLALAVASTVPASDGDSAAARSHANRALASELGLTDLALWPGTSYTRHPSQADLFAPFSDHPAALERWPAGSVVPPTRPWDPRAHPAPPGRRP